MTSALKYIFLVLVFINFFFMWPERFLSTTCCISNWHLFDDGQACEDGDVCLSVVVVALVVLCNQLHIYWYFILPNQSGYSLRRHIIFG